MPWDSRDGLELTMVSQPDNVSGDLEDAAALFRHGVERKCPRKALLLPNRSGRG